MLRTLREDPDSRRIIVSAWNVADIPRMALPFDYTYEHVALHGYDPHPAIRAQAV